MATIQGKYTVSANVLNCAYTITGGSRTATFSITGTEEELKVIALNAPADNGEVKFNVENEITIKRVKVVPNGAPGLQAALNRFAAHFELKAVSEDENLDLIVYDSTFINVPNWGEWFECNMKIRPWKRTGNGTEDFVGLSINPSNDLFSCDDYNVQDDYINQGVTPILYMEIETAGLYLKSNEEIF